MYLDNNHANALLQALENALAAIAENDQDAAYKAIQFVRDEMAQARDDEVEQRR